ncbi:hypothetical protein VPH35_046593 [Triticum aestivum]
MDGTRRGRRLLVSLCFLCLAVLLPGALLASPAAGRKRRQAGFDHYVLALQWPGTVCRQTNHCCSSNGCCRSNPLNWFTIHGLWPQYSYGGWPSCCRPTTTFNMNKIAMLRPILEKYWPSLYCGDTSTCFGGRGPFWAHERLMERVATRRYRTSTTTSPRRSTSTASTTSRKLCGKRRSTRGTAASTRWRTSWTPLTTPSAGCRTSSARTAPCRSSGSASTRTTSPGIAGRRTTRRRPTAGEAIALATSPSHPTNSLRRGTPRRAACGTQRRISRAYTGRATYN